MAEARALDKRLSPADRNTASEAETSSGARISRAENPMVSHADRGSMRPETPMGGSSGLALPRKQARARKASTAHNPEKKEEFDDILILSRSHQKPRKLYDRKALAMAQKAQANRTGQAGSGISGKAKLSLAFGILIVLGVGLSFALPEVTRVEKVTVNGMSVVSEAEIVDALHLSPQVNLVNADLGAMESRVLSNPKIARVRVRRSFPDRLVVDIAERLPVACVLVTEEIGTRSIAIDAQGIAFACLEQGNPLSARLPVLSGIRFEHFQAGQSLPAFLVPLLGDIAELSRLSPSPLEAFSEIKVQKIAGSEAEVLLYPAGSTVPIRMPARLNAANLGQALLVLDILAGRTGADKVEEVDFRTGTIVYKTKEAQAG